MAYIEVSFTVLPLDLQVAEILIANLAELGFESFSESETGALAYISETIYKPDEVDFLCKKYSNKDFSINFSSKLIEDQNWNQLWESNFEPINIENLCRVRAPFHQSESGFKLEIIIEPKMSFGTGHHQTTWLMIKELFRENMTDMSVLDMGCGTGILAIVAEKLGAKSVHAVDIDPWAVNNSIENIAANGCSKIEVELGDISKIKNNLYDIILANINLNILLDDIAKYSACIHKGGILMVSGILTSDITTITEKGISVGFDVVGSEKRNDWALVKFQKKKSGNLT